MKNLEKIQGSLIGGAIGDALGYEVEFLSEDQILQKYGEKGITIYSSDNNPAQISDDTQMSLFTANGLLLGKTRGKLRGMMSSYEDYIHYCYKDWYKTQTEKYPVNSGYKYTWLIDIPELFQRRAPGRACLTSLGKENYGTIENPINDSKGCGGVMRVAPIGLYFDNEKHDQEFIDILGAKTAALTHGHELGYIPAAILSHIVCRLSQEENITIKDSVESGIKSAKTLFPKTNNLKYQIQLIEKAIDLSNTNTNHLEAIHQLGEGWVAEETLAISIYCALKYPNNFEKAIITSVNHKGDSDSTGSVTGNIVGAHLGITAIPEKYTKTLELKETILEIAQDLYEDCQMSEYSNYEDEKWEKKYVR